MARVLVIGNLADSLINFRKPFLLAAVNSGHEVLACAPAASSSVEQDLSALGVSFLELPMSRAGINPLMDFLYFYRLMRLMRRHAPDVVVTYTIKPNIYGGLAARIVGGARRYALVTGLGYAFTRGAGVKRQLVRWIVELLYKRAFAKIDAVLFQNPDDRALFENRKLYSGTTPSVVVNGSGVDLDWYKQSTDVPKAIRFLMIARLLRDKGVVEYCEAAREIKKQYPMAEFILAGPFDPNPSAIPEHYVNEWESDGIGCYVGEIGDVRSLLASCAVYVLPSYREGTPRTVLEAMATGRAVITTDAPGCRETVLEGYNGRKVPVSDTKALAAAMRAFIDNPEDIERMGSNGRIMAAEKYDARKVAADMLEAMRL